MKIQNQLLEQIRKEILQKDYITALQSCFSALLTFDKNDMQRHNKELSSVMRNMSECHLNLRNVEAALRSASDSVNHNPTCDKVSMLAIKYYFEKNSY